MMLASLYMCLVIAGTTVFGETQSDVQKKSQTQYEFKNVYFIKPSEIDELSKSSTLLHIYFIASGKCCLKKIYIFETFLLFTGNLTLSCVIIMLPHAVWRISLCFQRVNILRYQ